jgi:uncharacterized protein YaaR (DUF327 family)
VARIRNAVEAARSLPPSPLGERPGAGPARADFRARLAEAHAGQLNERIEKALTQIDELGQRLATSLSLEDLKRYRQAIATLMRDLTHHMVEIKTQLDWDAQAWEHRTLVIIRKVNEELERLTEMVLSQEKDRLAILEKIGDIKGMLLDLKL